MEALGLGVNIGMRVSGQAAYKGGSSAVGAPGTIDVGATISASIGVMIKFGVQIHGIIQAINKVCHSSANKATEGVRNNRDVVRSRNSFEIGGSEDLRTRTNDKVISQKSKNSLFTDEKYKFGPPGFSLWRIWGPLGWALDGISKLFVTAHTPNLALMPLVWSGTTTKEDVKAAKLAAAREEYKSQKVEGSYTIKFSNGKKHHGKGSRERMYGSALEKMALESPTGQGISIGITPISFDWTPALNEREAYKDEYKRMQTDTIPNKYDEGYENPINYNIIQSKGKIFLIFDGH